jgi:glutamate synthase (NADPH/NADH) large chain
MHHRLHSNPDLPPRQGLYDPTSEHDACGVNFVADLKGRRSHDIVATGVGALCQLQHRGALGADPDTGDGAGILIQVPDRFFRAVVDFELPPAGAYATGIAFLPQDRTVATKAMRNIEVLAAEEGIEVLGWRDVPVDSSMLGEGAMSTIPQFAQIFLSCVGDDGELLTAIDLDRRVYVLRKRIEHEIHVKAGPDEVNEAMGGQSEAHDGVYFPSLSSRTFVYKGMLTTPQLGEFYLDLADERVESALALVHSRFSTNTFPSWPLAHPYRFIAHNGEINTVQGNRNWMRAREALMRSPHLPAEIERIFPICTPGASDTAGFDECLELLVLGGYSLQEAVLMMIPEAWENHESMSEELKAFYRYHASLMEPWDGPASIIFTDGTVVGAVLDRNGLRPSRYWVTDDDRVIMASEVGVVEVPSSKVIEKGRLQPGRMFFIDTTKGRIVRDHEIKSEMASARPYSEWLAQNQVALADLPDRQEAGAASRGLVAQYPAADVRLHPRGTAASRGADGPRCQRGDRVHGNRHSRCGAVEETPPALRLLPAVVRPGDQPTSRRHARGDRDLDIRVARSRGEPARPPARVVPPDLHRASRHHQSRARKPHRRRR